MKSLDFIIQGFELSDPILIVIVYHLCTFEPAMLKTWNACNPSWKPIFRYFQIGKIYC
jgi:hypothetical protein